jgi:hypothetical protein
LTITLNIHAQSISSKALTAFSFTSPAVTAAINESAKTVALTVPFGTDVTALIATFTTTGASVKVSSTMQTSGTTANNYTSPVTYTVIGTDGSTQAYVVTVTVASNAAKTLTTFSFTNPTVTGTINESAKTVALTLPYGTDVTTLVATFAVSSGASVKVGSTAQTSGTTANNFTSPVTYTVVAADGSTQAYVVTVTIVSNTAKALTAFSFNSPAVTATINETAKTIALTVPFGTDVTALVATFASTGASVKVGTTTQTSGTTANNFTGPVTYTVVAADGSTQAYVVTVTIAANTSKALTAFSFSSPVATGTINESAKTIAISVPFGTDVTALVATFASTGASVKVGTVVQTSGTTPNNFTSPVTYTVVAADGSTQAYVVMVTIGQNTAKALTAFNFAGLTPTITGTITESAKTVALTVPFGTDVTALVATFTSTGASVKVGATVQTSGTTPNNFTSPVTYTVVAADGSTQAYVVTVAIGANPAKALTSFSFASPAASGTITESAKTVALTVPFGTDVTALKASFVSTGASVKVGTVVQTSGTTPNNFTSTVTYTVVAADGSTQAYVVTVTIGANSAIIIATQPQDQTKCIGSPVSFSVAASTAVGTLSYQWKNASGNLTGGHFTGTMTTSLSISAVAAGDSGTYSCLVTSTGGGSPVTSSGAKLTVNTVSMAPSAAGASPSSVCSGGTSTLTETGGTLGTSAVWKWYMDTTTAALSTTGASISVSPTANTTYYVRAEGTCGNSAFKSVTVSYNNSSSAATSVSANPTSVCSGGSTSLSVTGGTLGASAVWKWYTDTTAAALSTTGASISVSPTANTTYYVRAEGTCGNTAFKSVTIGVLPSLTVNSIGFSSASPICVGTTNLTVSLPVNGGSNVHYAWTTPHQTVGNVNQFTIATLSSSDNGTYTCVVTDDCHSGASAITKTATLTVNSPPSISTQPLPVTVTAGTSATFSVVAAGSGTLSYQWQRDGANATGTAQSASYTLAGTTVADNGAKFKCIVTNSCNSVTSTEVLLTVNPAAPAAPTLISPSHNALDVSVGPTLSWNNVTNAQTYTVQVSKNNSFSGTLIANVPGLTTTTYNLTGLSNSTKYYWKVSATNAGGQGPATIDSFTTLITWSAVTSGLNGCGNVITFTSGGSYVFAGADAGIYRSSDNGATWTLVDNAAPSVTSMTTNGSYIFAANGYLYSSSNNGNGWGNLQPGSDNVECIAASNTALYLRDRSDDVYASTDNGSTWNNGYYAYPSGKIQSLCANGNSLFAGTGSGVYVSTDTGNTWKLCIAGVSSGLTISNGILYAGGSSGISYSIDNGSHWSTIGPSLANFESITCISASGNKIVTTTAGHCYFSPNNGQSWTSSNLVSGNYYNSCIISGGYILICGSDGISRSPLP